MKYSGKNVSEIIAETISECLKDRVEPSVLKRALIKPVTQKIYKRLVENVTYELIQRGKIVLPPGFGTISIQNVKEKRKKVPNRKTGEMKHVHVKGKRIVYHPGKTTKHIL